jgi:hypothetical protein
MINAYPYVRGVGYNTYKLEGNTYSIKEQLKFHGAIWSGTFWTINESELQYFPQIIKMIEVKHDKYCHMEEGTCYVSERELKLGIATLWCNKCDSNCINVPIFL